MYRVFYKIISGIRVWYIALVVDQKTSFQASLEKRGYRIDYNISPEKTYHDLLNKIQGCN